MKYKTESMPKTEKAKKILRGECWHEMKSKVYGGAECKHCGYRGGYGKTGGQFLCWYCPKSPDHICHYFSKTDKSGNKYVVSVNKEKIILKCYNPDHESSDCCIFCGDPEERK